MLIGVLDIMGSVEEHEAALKKCGVVVCAVKAPEDLEKIYGLIIPGGESTTLSKLIEQYHLSIEKYDFPVWGTCAGAILLAKHVSNRPPRSLRLMDMTIDRNGYGRQINSFETDFQIPALGGRPFHGIFIRAPIIQKTGKKSRILAEYDGFPVMVEEGKYLATTFHPELTTDLRIHEYFINMVRTWKKSK